MQRPAPGQRWISTSEPALGLGIVRGFERGTLEIEFPAAEETRAYAIETAPLVRMKFGPGDLITSREGRVLTVVKSTTADGLITYHGEAGAITETELLDSLGFVRPEKRLLAGLTDHPRDFDHRLQALVWNTKLRRSPARGFTGARIDLIPHQLAIVAETAGRLHPRVLLADEVGLGKTIEACLILHRLHLTGRAERILILVPPALVHQWFVELLRRFNLLFAIYDEDRSQAIEAHDPDANPFLDSQLVLAASDFLSERPQRAAQARDAGFDLLIIDEAHHLEWSPEEASPAYEVVESLAAEIPSLLMLTATPQQLGPTGHFARLRLLDPARYTSLDAFVEETESYVPLAAAVEALHGGTIPADIDALVESSPRAAAHLAELRAGDEAARAELVRELVDSFGTGRVLFRNTRERLSGFPKRLPHLHPLAPGSSPYVWLADLLRQLPDEEKVLLITHSPDAAIATRENLLAEIQLEIGLFHEDLSLLQRDRNAAWFAEPAGARLLVCSEIGSEGRNFQFASHLVLFGLPRDPEMLEQRIGRLDRIGQTGDIHIHVPYGIDSRSELQARWLHEGLDALSRPLKGATTLATELLPELDTIDAGDPEAVASFLARSRELKEKVARQLSTGHDRLLELGAPTADGAAELQTAIEEADEDARFEKFTLRLIDHLGLEITDLSNRTYLFHRGQRHSDAFTELPAEGLSATFDRTTALSREDLSFLSADHPLFRDALDQLLDGSAGNASFARWETGKGKAVLLECAFILEVIAPRRLHLDRFLPPTLVRVIVDHRGELFPSIPSRPMLTPGDPRRLIDQETFRREMFPRMLEAARSLATKTAAKPTRAAKETADTRLRGEVARLEDLAARNPQVSVQEIETLSGFREEILAALDAPRLRLDALRLIWRE